jgi:glycopeptide antibiotics resistance protein
MAPFYLALTLGYMGGLYWLSSIPGEVDPDSPLLSGIVAWTPPALQNLLHIPVYAVLAMLWYRTLRLASVSLRASMVLALLLTAAYGMADEFHQLYVPGRYASLTDTALNCLGAVLGAWLGQWWDTRGIHRK